MIEDGVTVPPKAGDTGRMRATRRHRPLRRTFVDAPTGVDLATLAAQAVYVGSPEHKTFPSFAGPPQPRADASKCDPKLADPAELTTWLREAMTAGNIGAPWEGLYPRYVWYRRADVVYEGRLVNQELGQYKGYPLATEQWPEELR
jgi:hypothetical protein